VVTIERALGILTRGSLTLEGRLPWSTNHSWLATVTADGETLPVVYKPRLGERPLWDFPRGTLCQRETAAFVVSQALGWRLVPPTVLRDGPRGTGAVQLFVPHDPDRHFLTLARPDPRTVGRIVALDVVTNNADRKSGHVLLDGQGALWLIDHGLTFHVEPKLRTVIWDLAGQTLPPDTAADLARLADALDDPGQPVAAALAELLSPAEAEATRMRTRELVTAGRFPTADPERWTVPWPPV
jgi:uncharacterized repeat protein (TIGR03843 family)